MTAFFTLLGLLCITLFLTSFTNLPAEFQACMAFILQEEISIKANIFINDLPIKELSTWYKNNNGQSCYRINASIDDVM